jgi:hypothetical protein
MLSPGVVIDNRHIACIGGAVTVPVAYPAGSDSCVTVHPAASQEISLLSLRADGSVLRAVLGQLPFPLSGHALFVHELDVWAVGGFSSNGVAPRCMTRIRFRRTSRPSAESAPELSVERVDVFNSTEVCIFPAFATLQNAVSPHPVWVCWGGFAVNSASLRLSYRNTFVAFAVTPAGMPCSASRVSQSGSVPSPRAGAAMASSADGTVVLHGGRHGEACYGDVSIATPKVVAADGSWSVALEWRTVQLPGRSVPRAGHKLFFDDALRLTIVEGHTRDAAGAAPQWSAADYTMRTGEPFSTSPNPISPRSSFVPVKYRPAVGSRVFALPFSGVIQLDAQRDAAPKLVNWRSSQFDPDLEAVSRTAPAPAASPTRPLSIVVHYGKDAPKQTSADCKKLSIESLKKLVIHAAGIDKHVVHDNVLIDYLESNGDVRPLHLPDILHRVLASNPETLVLHATLEEPPKNFQTCFGDPIGRGTFGTVYKAINQKDNTSFCLKRVKVDHQSPSALKALEGEIRMMRQLRHENLVKYLGSQLSGDKMYIFMEYVPGETLEKLCRAIRMTNRQIQLCVRQVLAGLTFLHSYNVVHRDIKGANVLFDAAGTVKVSDFGTAKHLNPLSSSGSNRPAGTILYMAPEIMRGDTCTTAADIWSLGCLVIEMAAGQHPYHEKHFTDGIQVVNAVGIDRYKPEVPKRLSAEGVDFVSKCLNFVPAERPSAAELLNHPFITHVAPEEVLEPLVTPSPGAAPAFPAVVDTLATCSVIGSQLPGAAPAARPSKLKRPVKK